MQKSVQPLCIYAGAWAWYCGGLIWSYNLKLFPTN